MIPGKIKFESITDLVKVTIWPVILIFSLWIYESELKGLIERINVVEVMGLKAEFRKVGKEKGARYLQKLTSLSEKARSHFLSTCEKKFPLSLTLTYDTLLELNTDIEVLQQLSRFNLIYFMRNSDQKNIVDSSKVFKFIQQLNFQDADNCNYLFPYIKYNSSIPAQDSLKHYYYFKTPEADAIYKIVIRSFNNQLDE